MHKEAILHPKAYSQFSQVIFPITSYSITSYSLQITALICILKVNQAYHKHFNAFL